MLNNLTLVGPASGFNFSSNLPQSEEGISILYPEFFNLILLTIVICQMYNGIEIQHPIYKIVFCNLCVSFLSSLMSVAAFPLIKTIRFSAIMNANNWYCIIYHYTSWCILSILRYLYIMHNNWLHEKFLEPKTIGNLGIAATFLTFFLALSVNLLAAILLTGWPRKGLAEAPTSLLIIRIVIVIGTFVLLLGVSCFFYAKILRHRGIINKFGTVRLG
jgi:hypothetical protein